MKTFETLLHYSSTQLVKYTHLLWALTNYIHFVSGIDVPSHIGDVTGIFGAVLRLKVFQSQSPLWALILVRAGQLGLVFPPCDDRCWIAIGQTLETHRAANRLLQHSPAHLCGLTEAWLRCGGTKNSYDCMTKL